MPEHKRPDMAPLKASALTEGLRSKLTSSLPLEARCCLATNSFTCRVVIPNKEVVVLDWVLNSLDAKYRDRPSSRTEELHLWRCLETCLQNLPSFLHYDFSTVPDFLLNTLAQADLSVSTIASCVSLLLPLGCSACPTSPSWSTILASLLNNPKLLEPSLAALASLSFPPTTTDVAPLVTRLSQLFLTHPQHSTEITTVASSLIFHTASEYTALLAHLMTEEQTEEKYQALPQAATLISCLESRTDPRLVIAAAKSQPDSLRIGLLSLGVFLSGGPNSICVTTAMGSRLQAVVVPCLARLQGILSSSLPLDLSLEVKEGLGVGRYLQDIVRHCLHTGGAGPELGEVVGALHNHHPQLLESLIPSILVSYLQQGVTPPPNVFPDLLDVSLKLRQVPKLVSKLFLHLRTLEPCPSLTWQSGDLSKFAAVLPSLPRVQILEMWKSLNYHFISDCLAENATVRVSSTCFLLGPLLSTLLTYSQLADHNLPSTLLPRITDLAQTTLRNLESVLKHDITPSAHRSLLFQVTSALADLSVLFSIYRNVDTFNNVEEFQRRVKAKILEMPEWASEPSSQRILQNCSKPGDMSAKEMAICENALLDEDFLPHIFQEMPDEILVKLVRSRVRSVPISMLEQSKYCSLVIMALLERANRGEQLYVPSPEVWTRPDCWTDLDSYLGKSIIASIVAFLSSEVPASTLEQKDIDRLASLPLEYLPPVLKLGATFVCLTQVFHEGESSLLYYSLAARCLESTQIYRHIDSGLFLVKVLSLKGDRTELLDVVTSVLGKFTKTIRDVDSNFHYFEESVCTEIGDDYLKAAVGILASFSKSLTDGMEGSDKKVAAEVLADKIAKYILKVFKKRNPDNSNQMNLLFEAAAQLVVIFAPRGLGKMAKMIHKLTDLAFSSNLPAWKQLLVAICHNLPYLDSGMLPEEWRLQAWGSLVTDYTEDCKPLVQSMIKNCSVSVLDQLLQSNLSAPHLGMWTDIVQCEMSESATDTKKAGVKRAVCSILQQARDPDFPQLHLLPRLLESVFSSSPTCLSPQLETLCLGCLVFVPADYANATLSALAAFLSHRGTLSTRLIPIITSLLRHLLPSLTTLPSIHSLQSVLGLFSRHKADWASVTPALLADLVHCLPSLEADCKDALTTAMLPLIVELDKHNLEHLASHLPPATNEVFKQVLQNYNTNHKFRGKV